MSLTGMVVESLMPRPREIVFVVTEGVEGGYDAKAQDYGIITQGEDQDDLISMVKDAVRCHFDDGKARKIHLVIFEGEEITI